LYLIEAAHDAEHHDRTVAEALRTAPQSQATFLWGCRFGTHTVWAFIEAQGQGEALEALPVFLRPGASVHRVELYSADDVPAVWTEAA
jgi:hypothetical protein